MKKNVNLYIWISDDYIKIEHSNCAGSQRFNTIHDAKMACSLDAKCIGVLEEDCERSLTYYLCQEDIKKDIEVVSCVHKKRETAGLFLIYHEIYIYVSTISIMQIFFILNSIS